MRVVILTASTMKKTINDDEYSGKCVTGVDLDNKRIVRFVSTPEGAPVENPHCDKFHALDIFDVSELQKCPKTCQTENIIGDYAKAKRCGKYDGEISDLYNIVRELQKTEPSFMRNRSYKLDEISPFSHSIELIKVKDLHVFPQEFNDEKKTKCSFQYNGGWCRFFSVTDPEYALKDAVIGDAYLAVSIPADKYKDKGYYKFVAAIYPIN